MIFYPIRPMSGGNLEYAGKIFGSWSYEPKYDGWRSLINNESIMWNRHGAKLTINNSFTTALEKLSTYGFEWYDAEALQRRHRMARGTLIILDIPSELTYSERREIMENNFPILDINEEAKENQIYIPPRYTDPFELWEKLKGNPFYEGIVGKKNNSLYAKQYVNSDKTFNGWIKYRYK